VPERVIEVSGNNLAFLLDSQRRAASIDRNGIADVLAVGIGISGEQLVKDPELILRVVHDAIEHAFGGVPPPSVAR